MTDEITPVIVGKEVVSDDRYIVASVCFSDGERVQQGDIIGSFETSKSVIDIEAPAAGFVFYNVAVDEDLLVGTVFAAISPSATIDADYFAVFRQNELEEVVPSDPEGDAASDVRFTKSARALLDQHGLNAADFAGRAIVRESDVLEHLNSSASGTTSNAVSQSDGTNEASFGNEVVIIGGGGHAKICIDILRQMKTYRIAGIVDAGRTVSSQTMGVPVIGNEEQLEELFSRGLRFAVVGFGALSKPRLRQAAFDRLKKIGFVIPNLIHPSAIIEPSVRLGEGIQIMAGAMIGSDARVGNNCIINSGSIVSHDCKLANNVHVTPGGILAGSVEIGENTLIGMGATILMNVEIGADVVINNGARVAKNVADGAIVKS